ncbi:MAG: hypothetical protein ACR2M1_06030 [Gemmatimonadaceae bacterium]
MLIDISSLATAVRAITLTEPWASLMVLGLKLNETRSWSIKYRGPVLVHAAKGMPPYARQAVFDAPFLDDLAAALGADTASQILEALDERRGKIIGQCDIVGCHRSEDVRESLSDRELAYGDYSDKRYAFAIQGATMFSEFVQCRGMLGLWTVPSDTLRFLPHAA